MIVRSSGRGHDLRVPVAVTWMTRVADGKVREWGPAADLLAEIVSELAFIPEEARS
jgi:hypothetical protein